MITDEQIEIVTELLLDSDLCQEDVRKALEAYERSKPKPEPVGYVKTVGGYPDESEHKVEWVVKHKELKDGQPLFTTPPTRESLSEAVIVDAYENSGYKQTLRPQDRFAVMSFARAIEQAHGIGATNDQPQAIPTW